jgi:hypothetical protein
MVTIFCRALPRKNYKFLNYFIFYGFTTVSIIRTRNRWGNRLSSTYFEILANGR